MPADPSSRDTLSFDGPPPPTTRAELDERLRWLETQWLPAIQRTIAENRGEKYRPALTLIEGGREGEQEADDG